MSISMASIMRTLNSKYACTKVTVTRQTCIYSSCNDIAVNPPTNIFNKRFVVKLDDLVNCFREHAAEQTHMHGL
jgi:hypothetical protein